MKKRRRFHSVKCRGEDSAKLQRVIIVLLYPSYSITDNGVIEIDAYPEIACSDRLAKFVVITRILSRRAATNIISARVNLLMAGSAQILRIHNHVYSFIKSYIFTRVLKLPSAGRKTVHLRKSHFSLERITRLQLQPQLQPAHPKSSLCAAAGWQVSATRCIC